MSNITIDSSSIGTINPELLGLVDGLANHEAKTLVAGVLVSHPEEWFTANRIHKEMVRRQQGEQGWITSNKMMGFSYCKHSLEPIGAVALGSIEGRTGLVGSYRASELGATTGLALVGSLSEWSLENPEVSLQELLGSSNSSGERRSPATRFIIFKSLLDAGNDGLTFGQIESEVASQLSLRQKYLTDIFDEPTHNEFFEVTTVLRSYNPLYRIDSAEYSGTRCFNELGETTRSIYAAMNQLVDSGQHEVTLDALIDMCVILSPSSPKVDLRRKLIQSLRDRDIPGLKIAEDNDRKPGHTNKSLLKIQPELVQPIGELVERIITVSTSEQVNSRNTARFILNNPRDFATLMLKARDFSPRYRSSNRQASIQNLVRDLVLNSDGLDLDQVQVALAEQGERVKRNTVRRALSSLVVTNAISMIETPIRDDKENTKRVYSHNNPLLSLPTGDGPLLLVKANHH